MKNNSFVNEQTINPEILNSMMSGSISCSLENDVQIFDSLLSRSGVRNLLDDVLKKEWQPVGVDGILKNYTVGDRIGNYRLSVYNQKLADIIWKAIGPFFKERVLNEYSMIEWREHKKWMPIGINPLFRFIQYKENGVLIPHYDAPYQENSDTQTIKSLVIYLTESHLGGETRFLKDSQDNLPLNERNFADQFYTPDEKDVLYKVSPKVGRAIAFDHRRLHDSALSKEPKIIMRTDIVYRKCYG